MKSTVYKYLVEMDRDGMIRYRNGVIDTDFMTKLCPQCEPAVAVGSIACGEPNEEEAQVLFKTSLPTSIFGKGPFYILYAKGDSMVDAGIDEGDVLVIRKKAVPRKGQIVVALDEGTENTLKLYAGQDPKTHETILRYQNKAVYGDKEIRIKEFACQGVLSHIIKAR